MKSHPGFKAVQSKIQHEGYSKKEAGAILASSSRKNKKISSNKKLKKVK